jgi:hypothetical protein
MKLDRNINGDGRGKYGLIKTRRLQEIIGPISNSCNAKNMDEVNAMKVREAIKLLEEEGILDWGTTAKTEFFVVRLKDQFAGAALTGYALAARKVDSEYAREVANLAQRAGSRNPYCRMPD